MFDDQQNTAGVPGNLPMEPVDMFANTEKDGALDGAPPAVPTTPNALSAGLLKKKDSALTQSGNITNSPTMPLSGSAMYEMKQPILGRILLLLFLLLVLGGIGFGGWYFYGKLKNGQSTVVDTKGVSGNINKETAKESAAETPVVSTNPAVIISTNTTVSSSEVTASMNNDKILFGESVDSDHDGLDDVREKQIGTDPRNKDSDEDGLSDGDEVIIWKTNPLNSDTDGDSYKDGSEVFHGYNPLGPGKLFNVPSSTTANATVSSSVSSTTTKK